MKIFTSVLVGSALLAAPALADKYYGGLTNAASGATLPAAFETLDDDTLSYCFNDLEANCFELPYNLLAGEVIEARHVIERKADDGQTTIQQNIWTWTPTDSGYHGVFSIQYDEAAPQPQTEGDFALKE